VPASDVYQLPARAAWCAPRSLQRRMKSHQPLRREVVQRDSSQLFREVGNTLEVVRIDHYDKAHTMLWRVYHVRGGSDVAAAMADCLCVAIIP